MLSAVWFCLEVVFLEDLWRKKVFYFEFVLKKEFLKCKLYVCVFESFIRFLKIDPEKGRNIDTTGLPW